MTRGMRFVFGICLALLAAPALAQPPAKGPPTAAELDKLAVEVLKDIHNRGAELYNRGDPTGCYRMYEGALLTVRPFLTHRPAAVKILDDGLAEVARTSDVKVQAFRLHEVIEQVRAELKKADTAPAKPKEPEPQPMPKSPTKPVEPAPMKQPPVKPVEPAPMKQPPAKPVEPAPMKQPAGGGTSGKLQGRVTLDGKPLPGAEVTLVSLAMPLPVVATAKVGADGAYTFSSSLLPGKYAVLVTGPAALMIPEKFQTTLTSGLTITVATGASNFDLSLQSK